MSKHAQFTAIVKKMASDDKKIVVNLEMVGKPDPYDLADIVDMVGDKVVVRLGNPQMAMNFDEDGREERRGLSVTTDRSGVVTQVSADTEDEHGDNHEDTDDQQNEGDPEQQSQEETDDKKSEGDQEANKQDDAVAAIDKDKLVAFILSGQAPAFDDVEYDFPALLARKQNGETWINIASSIGTSSTKLQAAWAKYKKLVSAHMAKLNGEEPGAA